MGTVTERAAGAKAVREAARMLREHDAEMWPEKYWGPVADWLEAIAEEASERACANSAQAGCERLAAANALSEAADDIESAYMPDGPADWLEARAANMRTPEQESPETHAV